MSNLVERELAPNEKRCSKCKEVKDRGEFRVRRFYGKIGLDSWCRLCFNKYRRGKRIEVKNDLKFQQSKIKVCYPRYKSRKGGVAFGSRYISFPNELLPIDCKYVKVKVYKDKMQIHFNPVNRYFPGLKIIEQQPKCHRGRIRIPPQISGSLDIFRPSFELRNSAGFYAQFFENDQRLLENFEFWIKGGKCLTNTNLLTIYKSERMSIADHLWPINAEYAFIEFHKAGAENRNNYIDLLPVSKTGFIVGVKKLDFKQFIGVEECSKVSRKGHRLIIHIKKFFKENSLNQSDWDLVKVLPSGALRFRFYKEREAKQREAKQRDDIAS